AGAAEDQDHQDVGRAPEGQDLERYGGGGLREKRARDAGDRRGDGVGLAQVRPARRADRGHARRVLADAAQRQAEGRVNNSSANQETQKQHRERVGVRGPAVQVELEAEQRADLDALEAVGAARERARAVRGLVQEQAEAEGEHDEREVAEADDDVAERVTQHPGGDRGGEQAGQGFPQVVLGEEPGAVRAEAEERGVAERYDPGVAEDQVERQREQRRDRDLAREREIARRDGERQQR